MKPKIGITIGDPNGIGAELILKLINLPFIKKFGEIIIISPKYVLDYYSKKLKLKIPPKINIIEVEISKDYKVMPGKVCSEAGKISGDAICKAVDLIKKNELHSIVTMPISKKSIQLAGYNFSGHTEMLRALTKSKDTFMFMFFENRVFTPLTIHIPLEKVTQTITKNYLLTKIKNIFKVSSKLFLKDKIKAAVLSLNPHSGEDNSIGNQENKIIKPVIKSLIKTDLNIEGPFSADGFFGFRKYKNYDLIIGMYHDQIMIPFKIISGMEGVNITAGLKFIRTSPAHGTAFDIAGKGIANLNGAFEALRINYLLTKKLINKNV